MRIGKLTFTDVMGALKCNTPHKSNGSELCSKCRYNTGSQVKTDPC